MYARFGDFDPKQAGDWISLFNDDNRDPSRSQLEESRSRHHGRPLDSQPPQGFGFVVLRDDEGNILRKDGKPKLSLIDGQHRSRGVLEAEKAINTVVMINVLPAAVRVMDTHHVRTVRQALTVGDRLMTSQMQSTIVRCIMGSETIHTKKPSSAFLYSFHDKYRNSIEWLDECVYKPRPGVIMAGTLAPILRADIHHHQSEDIRTRLESWLMIMIDGPSGADDRTDGAAISYIDFLTKRRGTPAVKKDKPPDVYLRTARSLEAFLRQEDCPVKKPTTDSFFPFPDDTEALFAEVEREEAAEQVESAVE